ncbi:hypothetical protein KKA00_13400, partial [bacterium]|nr:hypothetical protein [bacterium]
MIKHILSLLLIPLMLYAQEPIKPGAHLLKNPERWLHAVDDRAVGLLDKGELSNLFTNYGILTDFHLANPALHWPRAGSDVQHYGFGSGLILVADDQVIASIYDQSSSALDFGWEAYDGSLGMYHNDERNDFNTSGDDITPFLAFSDIRETWPEQDGVSTWPGYFRENLQVPGQYVEGEFTSDRDIFAVFQDVYGLGLRVHQTAYSYGRYYAEDLIIFRFRLFNDGDESFDSCYVGYQADLKPDFYADDYINYWQIEPYTESPSFFYKWDHNGVAQRDDSSHFEDLWEGPVGWLGMGMLETPDDLGITSFHYYHDDYSPIENEYFAAILQNDTASTLEDIDRYFHGDDPAFDDPALWQETDKDSLPGSEITFTIGSGPFSLAPGDSIDFAIVYAIGADSAALRQNVDMAYFMAHEASYQGSGPPATPHLTAVPGDGLVKLFWDNRAESSVDAISNEVDFEGYRIYKSEDFGATWGEPITNFFGDEIGWQPIVQFDLADSITGLDPAYGANFPTANKWLGDDTGIQHSYTDTDVSNGLEVWYCITAYDKGVFDPTDPSRTEPSYENVIGASQYDIHVVAVTPRTEPVDVDPGNIGLPVEIAGKQADGTLNLLIVEPANLLDHEYQITFNDSNDVVVIAGDTVIATELTLNLEDLTAGSFTFTNELFGEEFVYKNIPVQGDDQPIVNGFRIVVENIAGFGVSSLGWTTVMGDSSTFDWWTENRHQGNQSAYEEVVEGLDDWRITIVDELVEVQAIAAGFGIAPPDCTFFVPLQVERADYNAGGVWVDATDHLQISDLQLIFTGSGSVGPYGWDLIPGGDGYNPDPNFGTLWPDILVLQDDEVDTTGSIVYIFTQNGPEDATPPSVGDVFEIKTFKPFNNALVYQFSTEA